MKQSNKSSLLRHSLLTLFLILSLLFWYSRNGLPSYEAATLVTFDTRNIAEMFIGVRALDDWHSALFSYEGIGIAKIIYFFTADKLLAKYGTLFIFWIISMCITYTCLCMWLNKWLKTHIIYAACGLPIALLFAVKFNHIGLDTLFFSVILLIVTLVIQAREKKEPTLLYKIAISSVLFILLIHMASYRRNSLILIPLIIYFFLPFINKKLGKIAKASYALVGTALCVCFCGPITKAVFPTFHTHPVTPMMASDMRIAITLRGEEHTSDNPYIQGVSLGHLTPGVERGTYTLSQAASIQEQEDESWKLFVKRYIEEWVQHPGDMLMARFIQACEFYTGANLPSGVKQWTESLYPAIKKNPNAWTMPKNNDGYLLRQPICLSHVIHNYLVLLPAFLLAGIYAWRRNCKIFTLTGSPGNGLMLALSITYALSYLVATPTWDERYLMPSVLMAACVVFPAACSLILTLFGFPKAKGEEKN